MAQSIRDYFESIIAHTDPNTEGLTLLYRAEAYASALIRIRQAARSATQRIDNDTSTLEYWQNSADFWRTRSNSFELALRQIVDAHDHDRDALASERWEIATKALAKAKGG